MRSLNGRKGDFMIEHRHTLNAIKSDLLEICFNTVENLNSHSEYLMLLQNCLLKHFDINQCCFLLNEGETCKPYNIDVSLELKFSGIPCMMFEPYFYSGSIVTIPSFLAEKVEFNGLTHMLLIKVGNNTPISVVLLKATEKWTDFCQSEFFEDFLNHFTKAMNLLYKNVEIRFNENQYRKLYNMTDLFHSTMDIDVILKNVLTIIQENFPNFDVELILSNDQDRQTKVRIKPFDYLSERPSTIEAFVSGKITTEQASDLNSSLLNAPTKGRQAIYGILQVSAPISYVYSKAQKEFIEILAHSSGNALENAKLYHQSHRLISDLQLINETTSRLNMKLDINEMLFFLQKQLMKSFQPKELCFVLKEDGQCKVTNASTQLFKTEEGMLYISHVSNHFEETQDPLFIADFSRIKGADVAYKSMMAIPMIVEQRITGFSLVLHKDSYFFSFDSFKLMQSLIHHSSLAIANSTLRNQLQEMVDHDHLTKLYARSYLDEYVESALKNDDCGMFLLLDIDNFKRVNDTYGHQVGDEILVQIADQLRVLVGSRGICARWGGEEMAVYVPNISPDEAIILSNRIVEVIPEVTNPRVTISAGLVTGNEYQKQEFQTIFLEADTALYHAKKNGKNQVCIFNEAMLLHS